MDLFVEILAFLSLPALMVLGFTIWYGVTQRPSTGTIVILSVLGTLCVIVLLGCVALVAAAISWLFALGKSFWR